MKFFGMQRTRGAPRLGQLEIEVLELAWSHNRLTARDFLHALRARGIALSTMQTTLERLTRKGLLRREKHSRAFAYSAAVGRSELIARLMRDLSNELATGRIEPLLSGFLTLVDDLDSGSSKAMLEKLEKELAARTARGNGRE